MAGGIQRPMRISPPILFLAASALAVLPVSASADSVVTTNGVVATDFSLGGGSRTIGGGLIRLQLSNPTPFPEEIRLKYPEPPGYSDIAYVSATARVPAGSTSFVELPIPVGDISGWLSLTDSSGKSVELSPQDAACHSWSGDRGVYATPSVRFHAIQERLKAKGGPIASMTSSAFPTVLSTEGASPWAEDFRAYTRYAGCMLSADEFAELSPAVRTALLDYAAAGGLLCLFGTDTPPPCPFRGGHPALDPPPWLEPPTNQLKYVLLGRGTLVILSVSSAEELADESLKVLITLLDRTEKHIGSGKQKPESCPSWMIPVPPVHFAGVFLVLVLFSVLAGPVLVVVLARRNRRIHILWLLPAISAGFSLLLIAVFLLTNGIRPTLLNEANVLLDQGAGRAVVSGHTAILAPLSLRKGLVFDRGALLRPRDQNHSSASARHSIEIGDAQVVGPGWVRPGIVTEFDTLFVVRTHQRIEFDRDETGTPVARNLLGGTIDKLFYWDAQGVYYTLTAPLEPGATARLVLERASAGKPKANCYRADLGASAPFVADPLQGGRARRIEQTHVFGILDTP